MNNTDLIYLPQELRDWAVSVWEPLPPEDHTLQTLLAVIDNELATAQDDGLIIQLKYKYREIRKAVLEMSDAKKTKGVMLRHEQDMEQVEAQAEKDDKVQRLLDRAQRCHFTKIGLGDDGYLYASYFTPADQLPVGAELEPIVEAAEWGLDENNILTVNHCNATVLNSRTMLILDIDYGDRRFNKWVIRGNQDLINHMQDLRALDKKCCTHWSKQGWRIYQTAHGARVICLTQPWPFDLGHSEWLRSLGQFLGADPLYVQRCIEGKCYRARLTPKNATEYQVAFQTAEYPCTLGDIPIHPDIKAPLALHDAVARDYVWTKERFGIYHSGTAAAKATATLPLMMAERINNPQAAALADFLEEIKNM